MTIKDNYELKDITTFHLPVKCKYFVEYSSIDELRLILKSDIYQNNKSLHIGGGSNLLFTSSYDGIILHSKIQFIIIKDETDAEVVIEAGSGVNWDKFVDYCVTNDFYGVENMSYIPGEVGASAIQNIGSYGAEVKDVISKVYCIENATGEKRVFTNAECEYGYRDSVFKNRFKDKYTVTSVEYRLSKIPKYNLSYGQLQQLFDDKDCIKLRDVRNAIIEIRTSKLPDPKYIGSVGSFFKNPVISQTQFELLLELYPEIPHYIVGDDSVKVPAGWLIENAGLKGYKIGEAEVYRKQCLVIVNNGNATSEEIVKLYRHIIDTVKSKYGIELSPEANII